jgi:fluoride exporter
MDASTAKLISVATGGAVGTIARYLMVTGAVRWLGTAFPYGTLAVNVLGSFALGFLGAIFLHGVAVSDNVRLALTTGFTGGFTTYSAFNYEMLLLFGEGHVLRAMTYMGATLIGCLLSGAGGVLLARLLI